MESVQTTAASIEEGCSSPARESSGGNPVFADRIARLGQCMLVTVAGTTIIVATEE